MKAEPSAMVLAAGFLGAGISCLVLWYLHRVGLTLNDMSVQLFGWAMFAFLIVMASIPILRIQFPSAKRILKPLETDR